MGRNARADILADVAQYYTARVNTHGATAAGVDWRNDDSHRLRHQQFIRLLRGDSEASITDFGCGYGDFLTFCRAQGYRGRYLGCDISEAMIAHAQNLHGVAADRRWHVGSTPPEVSDYVVASGLFNVRQDVSSENWRRHVDDTIVSLAGFCRIGFGFNILSSWSDPEKRRDDLYYADPLVALQRCRDLFGRHVALLHDYGLWEFTIVVRIGGA